MLFGERKGLYFGSDITISGGAGSVLVDPKGDGYADIYYDTSSISVINYGTNGAIVTGLPPLFPGEKDKTSLNVLELQIEANAGDSTVINGVQIPNVVAEAFTIPLS